MCLVRYRVLLLHTYIYTYRLIAIETFSYVRIANTLDLKCEGGKKPTSSQQAQDCNIGWVQLSMMK